MDLITLLFRQEVISNEGNNLASASDIWEGLYVIILLVFLGIELGVPYLGTVKFQSLNHDSNTSLSTGLWYEWFVLQYLLKTYFN